MSFVAVAEAAVTYRVPVSILKEMCERGMIEGAVRFGRIWALPENFDKNSLSQGLLLHRVH
ncbi:MAG: DNA-binding protein [Butyricicoccus sp.]|nr:DNA-binding protein [Butyricicoccus sp.]